MFRGAIVFAFLLNRFSTILVTATVVSASMVSDVMVSSLLAETTEGSSPPPLSIESLFHPKKRFQYVESTSPATRWISDANGIALLLIRRDKQWMQVLPNQSTDGQSPPETAWPGTQTLVSQLTSLGDVDEKKALTLVNDWIGSSRSLDSSLITIESSVAIAGLKEKPRWITRQSSSWKDPTLSPDGRRVAYIQDHDLYVMNIESGRVIRLTDDGSTTKLNGRLDWVYQEEVYGRGNFKAFWWSEDSGSIAFLRIDTTQVNSFTFTTSNGPRGGSVITRYPKAGDPNPSAELWVAKLGRLSDDSFSIKPVFVPSALNLPSDSLIVRVGWRDKTSELVFAHTNRIQSELTLWIYDVLADTIPTPIVKESSNQWLEILGLPHWLPDGDFLWLSDLPSGYRRVWRISKDGSRRTPLTPENFNVRELVAVNQDDGIAWVTGDLNRGFVGQHVYQLSLETIESSDRTLHRVTDEFPWHNVSISSDHRWMVDRSSSLNQATTTSLAPLRRFHSQADKPAAADHDQAVFISTTLHREELRFPGTQIIPDWVTVPTPDNFQLSAYVFTPVGRQTTTPQTDAPTKQFPVLIDVYGGPLAPTVRDAWSSSRYLFHQFLASQGIGVMVVDNRSSGGKGLVDTWAIHRRVGAVETKDMIAAAQWLKTQPWVDGERIGIRGWSFGGFLTLHAMTHSTEFAFGIAGGSVTDWRNYDSIYTERYMGLPSENANGYESTSPLKAAKRLHGNLLMLHGEVDDNVHLANTLQMAEALQEAGKQFEMMIYPGSAHGVRSGMPTYHLMMTTWNFLERQTR